MFITEKTEKNFLAQFMKIRDDVYLTALRKIIRKFSFGKQTLKNNNKAGFVRYLCEERSPIIQGGFGCKLRILVIPSVVIFICSL